MWRVSEVRELLNYKKKSIWELINFPAFILPYKRQLGDTLVKPLIYFQYHMLQKETYHD